MEGGDVWKRPRGEDAWLRGGISEVLSVSMAGSKDKVLEDMPWIQDAANEGKVRPVAVQYITE